MNLSIGIGRLIIACWHWVEKLIENVSCWPEVESRTQGSRPRPKTAFPRTDTLEAKDRNARGQGPGTQAQVLSKKKVFTKTFQAISKKKKVFTKIFQADIHKKTFSSASQKFNNSKNTAVLEPRTGQFSRT